MLPDCRKQLRWDPVTIKLIFNKGYRIIETNVHPTTFEDLIIIKSRCKFLLKKYLVVILFYKYPNRNNNLYANVIN